MCYVCSVDLSVDMSCLTEEAYLDIIGFPWKRPPISESSPQKIHEDYIAKRPLK